MPDRVEATLFFDERVSSVRGVAQGRAASLSKLGVETVRDLLTHFPRRYIDLSAVSTISKARIGGSYTIAGTIHAVTAKRPKKVPLVEITLVDGTGTLQCTCFRQMWLADKYSSGQAVAVSGKIEFFGGFKCMTNPIIEPIEADKEAEGRIIPVHPASAAIPAAQVRRLVAQALDRCRGLEDPLPLALRTRYRLYSRSVALHAIHFPRHIDEVAQARRRLVFEELLLLELHLMLRAQAASSGQSWSHVTDGPASRALAQALPFDMTDEQQTAREEICAALGSDRRANHLLLGDVGTGKTAVAAFALAAAADTGTQALMMAPTEVLANQYALSLGPLLDKANITWGLLTGSTEPAERLRLLESCSSGELCVLFGTHALLEPDVSPACCSVVVIDEQQRFGAEQRTALVAKGRGAADVLSLTATPIPRSLALALYGDMTLSYLRKRPRSTAGTTTHVFPYEQRGDAYEIVRAHLQEGRQAYVVCPLVGVAPPERDEEDRDQIVVDIEDENDFDGTDRSAALKEADYLGKQVFPGYRVAVLHGRMATEDKARVMDEFREGSIDVLVSTTVIEVGVDVPNATAMIVEDADRFGLSQLHQLRGRVGRGEHAGEVCLISRTKSPVALERLAAMERTDDGFELASLDLSLRREGDILGNRQHGASILKLVNVVRDAAVIEEAHRQARAILREDPDLSRTDHRALALELKRAFAQSGAKRKG